MTVIAALADGGNVYMASDRITNTEDGSVFDFGESKVASRVYDNRRILVGNSGLHRVTQELMYEWLPPDDKHLAPESAIRYVVRSIERHFRRDESLWSVVHDREDDDLLDARILVGLAGRIWTVGADFSHGEPMCGYAAIGSGKGQAEGAMHALLSLRAEIQPQPAEIVMSAVQSAITHLAGLGPPIDVAVA